ncbi:PH domain-containing protein [uncultured Paraglaciecola sp.]|uniref:PH domain-containing protein n=1 Tax=uncultured Paraglaciecola sp. TaxID=1765024 RepID=UPI0026220D38|nr:PH domain-containing protein [uncultured Paraglaciecola sp.]
MLETHFDNPRVHLHQLPTIVTLDKQRLSEKYASLNRLINLSFTLFLCVMGLLLYWQPLVQLPHTLRDSLPLIIWVVALVGLLLTWIIYASDQCKFYTLRELDLHYASGLFFRKIVSQPITRIQHMELKRGPIERKVGLARLQVFSAGGAMHTFEIPGLPIETAQQIRQFILQHKDVLKHG